MQALSIEHQQDMLSELVLGESPINIEDHREVLSRLILAVKNMYIGGNVSSIDILLADKGLINRKLLGYGYISITSLGYYFYKKLLGEIDIDLQLIFSKPGTIVLVGEELFFNPIVRVYHEYILDVWEPVITGKIALFTPCSNIKPIPESFMNKKIDAILRKYSLTDIVDRYIVSEPLGIIQYEQAYLFPAAHYDYPPEKLTDRERPVYIDIVAGFLRKIMSHYEFVVYTLPRRHRQIFEQALEQAGVNAVYIPYNIYYLPRLRNKLIELASNVHLLEYLEYNVGGVETNTITV